MQYAIPKSSIISYYLYIYPVSMTIYILFICKITFIDHIGFINMKRGKLAIIVKYDESKSDKAGENCTNKNIY